MMKSLFLITFFFFSISSWGSSCCGGGSSSSMIITGDNVQELNIGFGHRNDLGQTDSAGWASFHDSRTKDQQSSLSIQYQRMLQDQLQLGGKISFIDKNLRKQGRVENKSGPGDFEVQGTWEFLPERTYSFIKPRGFLYSKFSLPNSKSLYDSHSVIYSDVRGSGLYTASLGTFFLKRFSLMTLKAGAEVQHLFGRTFSEGKLDDYNKFILPLGATYSFDPAPISWGLNSTWNYQTKKKFSGTVNSVSAKEYFWEIGTFINWTVNREETWGVSYADSTIVGKNINSPLYRSFGLSYTLATAL